ncbi:MAG: energy transducer TonB [Chitinophagales bacterium]|nr:energy transducer TonB [Chitinophagales bacterium]
MKTFSITLALLCCYAFSFAQSDSTATEIKEDFNKIVEMPRFPGCEHLPATERKKCADLSMLKYIYSHIKYPPAAKKAGVEGTAIVQFTVNTDGTLSDTKIVRNPGYGTGEELERVVHQMVEDNIIWIPGKNQKGEFTRVMFNLPIKFRL